MSRKNRARARKARNGNPNTARSTRTQGVDLHYNEQFNDYSLITIPATSGPGFYTVRFACDVNGYSYTVLKSGTLVSQFPNASFYDQELYNERNGLFSKFAGIYAQYRMESVHCQFEPVASGANVSVLPVIHCVDEDNVLGVRGQAYGNLLPQLGFMKTGALCSPQKTCSRSFNYAGWLRQTMPTCWLQTQDPNNPTGTLPGIRQVYPTQKLSADPPFVQYPIKRSPALVFVFGVNVIELPPEGVALGAVRMRTRFSFRQRNLIPTGVDAPRRDDDDDRAGNEDSSTDVLTASTRSKLANVLKSLA